MHGQTELLAREDAVEAECRVVDPVVADDVALCFEYGPGSWGPQEADQPAGERGWSDPVPWADLPEADASA